jgi:hypothetical protein
MLQNVNGLGVFFIYPTTSVSFWVCSGQDASAEPGIGHIEPEPHEKRVRMCSMDSLYVFFLHIVYGIYSQFDTRKVAGLWLSEAGFIENVAWGHYQSSGKTA